jgi:hypothetical protein
VPVTTYNQWQKEHLKERAKILRKLKPLQSQIESWEADRIKVEAVIARLNNQRRLEDALYYFSRTNINEEIRNRFAGADVAVLETIIDILRDSIIDPINNFHKNLPRTIQEWKDRGSKAKDPALAWVKDQSAKFQDAHKKLEDVIHAVEAGDLWSRLTAVNILSDPSMRAVVADEFNQLEALQAAIEYSQMSQDEINKILQSEKLKLEEIQEKILSVKTVASKLQEELDLVESTLYITEEKFLSEYISTHPVFGAANSTAKKWCFSLRGTPVYDAPSETQEIFKIPQGRVVDLTGKQQNTNDVLWSQIVYTDSTYSRTEKTWISSTIVGWVKDIFLEDYIEEEFPDEEVSIPHQTQDPHDAQQYMFLDADFDDKLDADVKYNMCGELCVAYIVKNDVDPESDIETVIKNWRNKGKTYGAKTIRNGTTTSNLKDILQTYEHFLESDDPDEIMDFREGLADGVLNLDGMKERIKTHYLIALITIDHSGALISRNNDKTLHWVVLERITRGGNGVEIYNPFPNKREEYSLNEFIFSCRPSLSGIWVKRKEAISLDLDRLPKLDAHPVDLGTDRHDEGQAEQYIYREGKKKTNLCGEFSTAYIIGRSMDNALDYWKTNPPSDLQELVSILKAYGLQENPGDESMPNSFTIGTVLDLWKKTQPQLYEHHVRNNKPTGTRELRTILMSYGYNNDDDFKNFRSLLIVTTQTDKEYLPTPGRIAETLKKNFLIAGVGIDRTGRLKTRGSIRHWVVVEKMTPAGKHYLNKHFGGSGGWVELYNPFMNRMEGYSYREFTDAMSETGLWDGLWVKRDVKPIFKPQDFLPPLIDEPKGKKDGKKKKNVEIWPEKRLRGEIAKRIEKGKKVRDIPNLLFRASGWSKEAIANLLPASDNQDDNSTDTLITLVLERLGVESLPTEIEEWLTAKAKKNSSFAVDLAYALRESRILVIEDKKARVNDPLAGTSQGNTVDFASKTSSPILSVLGSVFASRAMEEIKELQPVDHSRNL